MTTASEQLLLDIFLNAEEIEAKVQEKKKRGRKHYENLIAYQKRQTAKKTRPSDTSPTNHVSGGKPNHSARANYVNPIDSTKKRRETGMKNGIAAFLASLTLPTEIITKKEEDSEQRQAD